ncbi:MAG: hypothetical protein V9G29_15845 [Burkholderiaceae bacterium]
MDRTCGVLDDDDGRLAPGSGGRRAVSVAMGGTPQGDRRCSCCARDAAGAAAAGPPRQPAGPLAAARGVASWPGRVGAGCGGLTSRRPGAATGAWT